MKKLTAGIFSVLMGLVSVNAAEAAVASKGYVDAKIGDTGDQTVVEMINSVSSGSTQANTALAGRVTTAESEITTLKGDESVAGSVAQKIADAIAAEDLTNKFAAKQDVANITLDIDTDKESDVKYPSAKAVAEFVDVQISNVTGGVGTQLSSLQTLIETNKSAADTGIQEAKDAAASAEAAAKTYADEKDAALGDRVGALETDNTTNKADIDALQETVAKLDGNGEGSIAKQIETVTAEVTRVETEYKAADTALDTKLTKAISDGDAATLDAAKAADAEQTTAITTAYQDADAALKTELQGYADQAEAAAIETAGTNADAKITKLNLAALSRVPVDCQDPDSFCVLTAKGGQFYWEAIERATGEDQPEGTDIPGITQ